MQNELLSNCMHALECMIVLCLTIRFRPTSLTASRLYGQRTMSSLRTNEEARSNELKQISA